MPDKGKKISDAVTKLKAAIAEREEVRGRSELFYPVSLDCKERQKAIAVVDGGRDKAQNSDQILDTSSPVPGCSSVANITSSQTTSRQQGLEHLTRGGDAEATEAEHTVSKHPPSSSRAPAPSSSFRCRVDWCQRLPATHRSPKSGREEWITALERIPESWGWGCPERAHLVGGCPPGAVVLLASLRPPPVQVRLHSSRILACFSSSPSRAQFNSTSG